MSNEHERRQKGVSFHKDEEGVHWTAAVFKTYQVALALILQLVVLVGAMWGIVEMKITPLIDSRIEFHDKVLAEDVRRNNEYIIQHRAEVQAAMQRMEEFKKESSEDRARLNLELNRMNAQLAVLIDRVDSIYRRK